MTGSFYVFVLFYSTTGTSKDGLAKSMCNIFQEVFEEVVYET